MKKLKILVDLTLPHFSHLPSMISASLILLTILFVVLIARIIHLFINPGEPQWPPFVDNVAVTRHFWKQLLVGCDVAVEALSIYTNRCSWSCYSFIVHWPKFCPLVVVDDKTLWWYSFFLTEFFSINSSRELFKITVLFLAFTLVFRYFHLLRCILLWCSNKIYFPTQEKKNYVIHCLSVGSL